jgi:hypothetical protein
MVPKENSRRRQGLGVFGNLIPGTLADNISPDKDWILRRVALIQPWGVIFPKA